MERAPLCLPAAAALLFVASLASAQAIEFESGGLNYKTLTKSGMTIMFAPLPSQVRNYVVIQVAVANGSPSARTIKPEDFQFVRNDGTVVKATPAGIVVGEFLRRGGRDDVIKLVSTYEMGLYGMSRFKSTNGYEERRQAALAEVQSSKLKAAAAASAIVLVAMKLNPGQSTDGAVFFPTQGKSLGQGKLVATPGVERFEFDVGGLTHPGELIRRP